MSRLVKLQSRLRKGEALLLGSADGFDANAHYYFGWEEMGAFLVTRNEAFAFTREAFGGANWTKINKFSRRQLPAFLAEHKVKRLLFDEYSAIAPAALRQASGIKLMPSAEKMLEQRVVKDAEELGRIRKAQDITKKCVARILEKGIYGKTDNVVAGLLELEARECGVALNSFEPIVLVNEEARKPHGEPSNRPICKGDLVLIDVGAVYKRYHGDYSSTLYEGKNEEIRRAIAAVKEAKAAAERKAKPGVKGSALTKAALAVLKERGFEKTSFKQAGLSLGHHVGLDVHEGRRLDDATLRKGMAFTIEPGVYAARYGVRFEDVKIL